MPFAEVGDQAYYPLQDEDGVQLDVMNKKGLCHLNLC